MIGKPIAELSRNPTQIAIIPTCSSNPMAWSILRGKPSTRNLPQSSFHPSPVVLSIRIACIAFSSNFIVTCIGTIVPSRIYVLIRSPYCEPLRFCSARRRSPARERTIQGNADVKEQKYLIDERNWTCWRVAHIVYLYLYRVVRSKVRNYCEGYLPAPGPPSTKTTVTFLLSNIGMDSVAARR